MSVHNHELSLAEIKKEWHGSLKAYTIGFIASLILTSISFTLVILNLLDTKNLLITIAALALAQAAVQLLFFLHLGQEAKPRWESVIFIMMFLILIIIAVGSLWIMNDLNERMMPDMTATTETTNES